MSASKTSSEDYIQWLIASPKDATMTESARTSGRPVAHDSYRRLLLRLEPTSDALWDEVRSEVELEGGYLVLDDTTLDHPYGPKIELVVRHWSGKHRRVVDGINLITLLWTDGQIAIPVDYRIFDKARDGKTKNDHFQEMLENAQKRGFQPDYVVFDSWYSSLDNLKLIDRMEWTFLTGLKSNRLVSPIQGQQVHVGSLLVDESGLTVHLRGFGFIRVFQTDREHADVKIWATNATDMTAEQAEEIRVIGLAIEQYHRSLKQDCLIERCQARTARIQRNHIGLAIRAFFRLELHRYTQKMGTLTMKRSIIQEAIRIYRSIHHLYIGPGHSRYYRVSPN